MEKHILRFIPVIDDLEHTASERKLMYTSIQISQAALHIYKTRKFNVHCADLDGHNR